MSSCRLSSEPPRSSAILWPPTLTICRCCPDPTYTPFDSRGHWETPAASLQSALFSLQVKSILCRTLRNGPTFLDFSEIRTTPRPVICTSGVGTVVYRGNADSEARGAKTVALQIPLGQRPQAQLALAAHIARVLIRAECHEARMPEMSIGRPFEELELPDEDGLHPPALVYLRGRQPLSPAPTPS